MQAFHYQALPVDVHFASAQMNNIQDILHPYGYQRILIITVNYLNWKIKSMNSFQEEELFLIRIKKKQLFILIKLYWKKEKLMKFLIFLI